MAAAITRSFVNRGIINEWGRRRISLTLGKKKQDKNKQVAQEKRKSQQLNRGLSTLFISFLICVCARLRLFFYYYYFIFIFEWFFLSAERQFRRAVWEEMRPVRDAV